MIRSSIVPGLIVLYVFILDIESGIILVVTIPIVIIL